ncbi:MAG TPA: hypothetical protein VGP72_21685 [Planctomycetota bacterium]|jgi:beta-mannosidase
MQTIDLNGTWKLTWSDGQRGRAEYAERETIDDARYIDAAVPGEVHLDAMRAGWIGDPCLGTNCLAARWVEECIWSYRREFDFSPADKNTRVWLVFETLDLYARIVLNGVEVGRHGNVFKPCRVEVTGKLKPGKNVLAVHLDAGLYAVADKKAAGLVMHDDGLLHKRHWLRKPQCQFAWDWATRLLNVGISGPVRLEFTDAPARVDQFVPLAELSSDLKQGTVRARLFVQGIYPTTDELILTPMGSTQNVSVHSRPSSGGPVKARLTAQIVETGDQSATDIEIKPGLQPYEVTLKVANPKLWWPVGHGPQNRYTVRVSLEIAGKKIAEKTARIGFRHVRVNQEQHPQTGRYFIVEINGKKIFVKGGNFVPADMIVARLDRARYATLVDRALEANFNMLRIWGGGLYESDDFYDLCDEKGILVWQEFIFACSRYPTNDVEFHENVTAEATHQIRRLAEHPSLIIWCGNNEMEQGSWDWGYDKKGEILPDYGLFHLVLPRLLKTEDPTRYYQPSSPYSPDGSHPNRDEIGDQHPWSIGFHNTDFREYRRMACRFPNEGGTLGPTALPTVLACLPEGQQKVQSFAWQLHDNSVDSWGFPSPPDQMLEKWLGRDIRKMSIEEYVYWGGLVQGEGLKEYCENFRRRMFDSASAIFWMYNDTWPAVRSWTIVDYYLRRTPAFWSVRRALAPVHVILAIEDRQVSVFGINETSETIRAELRFGVFNLAGGYPLDRKDKVVLPPNASTKLASFSAGEWTDAAASLAFAILEHDGKLLARNRLQQPIFKDMRWPKPHVTVRRDGNRAIFESPAFAWGVCVDLNGEQPLADNFFDLYPGIPYAIPWTGAQNPTILNVGNL